LKKVNFSSENTTSVAFDIEVATRDAEVTYSHAGELLVAHSTRGADATPEHVRAFVQFVRYRFGGHPLVLARLASQQRIPETLRLRALMPVNLDDGAVSIRVTETREVAPEPPLRHGAPAIFAEPAEPIDAILLEQDSRSLRDDRPPAGVRLAEVSRITLDGSIASRIEARRSCSGLALGRS
jgi:hypothetical protein